MQKLPSSKWCIKLVQAPPKVWISDNGMVQFDTYEEWCRYNDEMGKMDMEREEREEQQQWSEEYYRRRNDPYWKNDSDYD